MNRSTIIRIILLAAIVVGWIVLRSAKPEWAAYLVTPWTTLAVDHGWWVPAASGGLLAVTAGYFLWAVYGPTRSRKADDAMALGCLTITAIGIGVVLAVLGLAVVFRIHMLVNIIGFTTLIMAAFIIPQLIWALATEHLKKR